MEAALFSRHRPIYSRTEVEVEHEQTGRNSCSRFLDRAFYDTERRSDDGTESRPCDPNSELYSGNSVLLWSLLQKCLEVRTVWLRLGTGMLFPSICSLAWGLSSRLLNSGRSVQTLSWLLKRPDKKSAGPWAGLPAQIFSVCSFRS
jgi:hypothetical protein